MNQVIALAVLVGVGIAAAPMIEEMFDAPVSAPSYRNDADFASEASGRPDVSVYDRYTPNSHAGPATQPRPVAGNLGQLKSAYDSAYRAYQLNPTQANYQRVQAAWNRLESARHAR